MVSKMGKRKDLTGMRFGKLTVLSFEETRNGHAYWKCVCDCGETAVIRSGCLSRGDTRSCGCLKKENGTSHGMTDTHFYNAWLSMKDRCFNAKRKTYKYYGGAGITVCERWLIFENFKNDMFVSYGKHVQEHGEHDTTLDRIDSKKDYTPENCRWATRLLQNNNRKGSAKMIEGKGLGGKKVNRVNISLTNEVNKKLTRLAKSCEMKHTTLAALLVEMCLDDPVMINKLQSHYNVYPAYKIVPVHHNGKTEYVLRG